MTPEQFVTESNRIEGIIRPPTRAEIEEFHRFIELDKITITELKKFVSIYQPNAVLRYRQGLDVRVGGYIPPSGGAEIAVRLEKLLSQDMTPLGRHIAYESLHPFTDGNGRSGRMLWAWDMGEEDALALGFLHSFYYQTLSGLGSADSA